MGILEKTDVISTVSGGSIAGAYYCYCKEKNKSFDEFHENMYQNLKHNLEVKAIINIRTMSLLIFVTLISIFIGFQHTWLTGILTFILASVFFLFIRPLPLNLTEIKALWYDNFFYNKATLEDLPDKPELVINSTNIETGKMWIFTKKRMGDYTYTKEMFNIRKFKLSRAVASSSAVPGIFEPIRIGKNFFIDKEDAKKNKPALSDGGIYDNQGVHKICYPQSSYKCKYIICSNAASPLVPKKRFPLNIFVLNRTNDIMMAKIKNMQFQEYVYHKEDKDIDEIAYYSFHLDIKHDITKLLAKKPPRLQNWG
jgi:NTE family protein